MIREMGAGGPRVKGLFYRIGKLLISRLLWDVWWWICKRLKHCFPGWKQSGYDICPPVTTGCEEEDWLQGFVCGLATRHQKTSLHRDRRAALWLEVCRGLSSLARALFFLGIPPDLASSCVEDLYNDKRCGGWVF